MKNTICILLFSFFFNGWPCYAHDGFETVQCKADIPKALLGQIMSNERVVAIEERHRALGLKDLGGTEISGRLFSTSWLICGKEFMLIEKKSVVCDVLPIPPHSKDFPEFVGTCRVNSRDVPETIVAILENKIGEETLTAKMAWKIDEEHSTFVKIPTAGLRCPRLGIITQDGGL